MNMQTTNIEVELTSTIWAMERAAFRSLAASIGAHQYRSAAGSRPPQGGARTIARGIAHIPLIGGYTQHAGLFGLVMGWTNLDWFVNQINTAVADASVGQILLEVDSSGGAVYGTQEAAAAIRSARRQKPVVAHVNSIAAAGAYWIASQADEVFVTPGGEVGGIGMAMLHADESQALQRQGVSVSLISAGRYKTEGSPFRPLDPEARRFMQSRVDDYYRAMTNDIARGRSVTVDTIRNGQGSRLLGARDAEAAHLVDGVMTQAEVIRRMTRADRVRAPQVAAAQTALNRIERGASMNFPRLSAAAAALARLEGRR